MLLDELTVNMIQLPRDIKLVIFTSLCIAYLLIVLGGDALDRFGTTGAKSHTNTAGIPTAVPGRTKVRKPWGNKFNIWGSAYHGYVTLVLAITLFLMCIELVAFASPLARQAQAAALQNGQAFIDIPVISRSKALGGYVTSRGLLVIGSCICLWILGSAIQKLRLGPN